MTTVVTVKLDAVQLAWLDAIADVWGCTRSAVIREALRYLAAREHERVMRSRRRAALQLALRAAEWDPITAYLAGREVPVP